MERARLIQRAGFRMCLLTTIGGVLVYSRSPYLEAARRRIATVSNDGVVTMSNTLHPDLLQSFSSHMPEYPALTFLLRVIPGRMWQIQ